MLTQERLKVLYVYEETKGLFWSRRTGKTVRAKQIKIDGKFYLQHRLAWLYVYGELPSGILDHKNRDGITNTIDNLRPATFAQNTMNSTKRRGTSSRFKGVSWCKLRKKWRADIRVDKVLIRLGSFEMEEQAADVYNTAARQHFGEFAWLNEIPTIVD